MQVSNGRITLYTSELCLACPLLRAAKQPIMVNLSSGALRELLQVYRNADYAVDSIYLPEIEWAMNGQYSDKDFEFVQLVVGGSTFQVAQSLLDKIPYFQASSRFSGKASLVFDRDPDAFVAYLEAKQNPNLINPAAQQEAVFWMDSLEAPTNIKQVPPAQPVHHVKQESDQYLTFASQITMFKNVYRRHTPMLRRVYRQDWDTNKITIQLDASMHCLGKIYLRNCPIEMIKKATLSFGDIKFVQNRGIIEIENANTDQRNGVVLFGQLGFSWPLLIVPGTLTIKLVEKQQCQTALVCATMESSVEINRFRHANNDYLCRVSTSFRAKELVLPQGAILAVFVKGTNRGGVYHEDKLISHLDETIDCNLPEDWHMIQYCSKSLFQAKDDLQGYTQPSGHLASNGEYKLLLDQECEIQLIEYAMVEITNGKAELEKMVIGQVAGPAQPAFYPAVDLFPPLD